MVYPDRFVARETGLCRPGVSFFLNDAEKFVCRCTVYRDLLYLGPGKRHLPVFEQDAFPGDNQRRFKTQRDGEKLAGTQEANQQRKNEQDS